MALRFPLVRAGLVVAVVSMAVMVIAPADAVVPAAQADIHGVPTAGGALAGKTVVVSPGHGCYSDGSWQRGVVLDLKEDIHTNEIITGWLQRYLTNAGARTFIVRERSFQTAEVIVDNTDGGYSETGTWSSSTSATDYYGTNYRVHAVTTLAPHATATWTPTFTVAGEYPVYVWWAPGGNRNVSATYTINHPGGQSTVTIDQQLYHGHWIYLGSWWFDAGTSTATGSVTLSSAGGNPAQYSIADAARFGGGVGALSGNPRWQECADLFLEHIGYPGFATYGDVTVRPNYAGWLTNLGGASWTSDWRYLAVHTNAGGGRGTSTFTYSNGRTPAWGTPGPATHPAALVTASDGFGSRVQNQFVSDMRALWEPGWQDRGHMIMNFGELRDCLRMPSALVELMFHDDATDVGYAKRDDWRHDAARSLYKSVVRDFNPAATIVPLPPSRLRVTQSIAGQYTLRFEDTPDALEPSATATSYKVYRSPDGRSWDDGTIVPGTTATFTGAAGATVFVRVAAVNAGGESLPTQALAVRVAEGDNHGGVLMVYGFDRVFGYFVTDGPGWADPTNTYSRYRDDYIAAPALALSAYGAKAVPFDSATNEAVEAGLIDLKDYHCVMWILGEESTVRETFSAAEQAAVDDYLQNAVNPNLFVSGAEIGWDLDFLGSGADKTFYNGSLYASYVADDAGTHTVAGTPGGPFNGLALNFADGTSGAMGDYDVDFPDVLATSNGSAGVLDYVGGTGGIAGVMFDNGAVAVLNLGFPFERVLGTASQQALMAAIADVLLATYTPPVGGGGGGTSGSCGVLAGTATPDDHRGRLLLLILLAVACALHLAIGRARRVG